MVGTVSSRHAGRPGARPGRWIVGCALAGLLGCASPGGGSDGAPASPDAGHAASTEAEDKAAEPAKSSRAPSDEAHRIVALSGLTLEVPGAWTDAEATGPGEIAAFTVPAPEGASGEEAVPLRVALVKRPKGYDGSSDAVLSAWRARFTQSAADRAWDQERAWKAPIGAVRWLDVRGDFREPLADGTTSGHAGWRGVLAWVDAGDLGELRVGAAGPEEAVARAQPALVALVNGLRSGKP